MPLGVIVGHLIFMAQVKVGGLFLMAQFVFCEILFDG